MGQMALQLCVEVHLRLTRTVQEVELVAVDTVFTMTGVSELH